MNRKKGFTLAEFLIVIAIIGVLVAVSVPVFTAQRSKTVDAVNKANIRAAKAMALAAFYDDKTGYVASANGTQMAYFKYTDGRLDPIINQTSAQVNNIAKTVCTQAAERKHQRRQLQTVRLAVLSRRQCLRLHIIMYPVNIRLL